MNKLSFRLVSLALAVLVAATAAVPSAATDARSGNARIKLSNNANSQRKNGASTAGAKSKNIDNYHSIVHSSVLTEEADSASKFEGSGALVDPRCSSCTSDCPPSCHPPVTPYPHPPCPTCPPPTHPTHHPTHHPTRPTHYTHPTHATPFTHPTYTPPPHTKPPPCEDCDDDACPPPEKPPTTKYPNLPSITYSTNCDFCDHDLYALHCVATSFDCAARCAVDLRCSHFTYIAHHKGGTCFLKKAFGSGGAWASPIPSPSPYVCGYIPSRALVGIFLNICVGLDITGTIRTGTA